MAGIMVTILMKQYVVLEPDTQGWLIPANFPYPPNPCTYMPDKAVAIYLGNSVAYTTRCPAMVLHRGREPLLSISKQKESISISAKTFSSDGRIVDEIINNEFYINPNNYFRRERQDRHILTIYDQQNQRVITIWYLNQKAIKVLGIFRLSGHAPIRVTEQAIHFNGETHRRSCLGVLDERFPVEKMFQPK